MKKILLVLTTLCYLTIDAQFQKGVVMLGGSANYWKSESEKDKETLVYSSTSEMGTVRFTPGFFVADRHLVGAIVSYNNSHFDQSEKSETYNTFYNSNTTKLGAGLFYRYHFMLKDSRFAIFAHIEGMYLTADSEESASNSTQAMMATGTGYSAGFRPGIIYCINKKIAVEASFGNFGYEVLNYTNDRNGVKEETSNSMVNAGFSLSSLLVGFTFYLGGKEDESK